MPSRPRPLRNTLSALAAALAAAAVGCSQGTKPQPEPVNIEAEASAPAAVPAEPTVAAEPGEPGLAPVPQPGLVEDRAGPLLADPLPAEPQPPVAGPAEPLDALPVEAPDEMPIPAEPEPFTVDPFPVVEPSELPDESPLPAEPPMPLNPPAQAGPEPTSPDEAPTLSPPAPRPAPLAPEAEPMPAAEPEPSPRPASPFRPNPLRDGDTNPEPLRPVGRAPERDPLRTASTVGASAAHSAGTSHGKGAHGDEPYDPIKANGPIFVGWTKPELALVITGRQDGYLEPCGCAGLDRMKGGMSRRHSFLDELRRQGWPVVAVDVGGIVEDYGPQGEMKLQTSVDAIRTMQFDTVALGKTDLRFPAELLLSMVAPVNDEILFVSANVGLFGLDAGLTPKQEIIERAGYKIGVTAVLGKKWQKEINNPEIAMADPAEALRAIVPGLEAKCDLLVLLAHATTEESIELGKQFPAFDVVVTAGGPAEPPARPEKIEGTDTLLIEVGQKGMDAIVLGYDAGLKTVRYQRVPLDSRFASSEEMKLLMTAYQDRLKLAGFAGLSLKPVPHPEQELKGAFVGSQECESCHEISYKVWRKSGHADAWDTLEELDPARTYDPECVSCHVVGWHTQQYFPYKTGFWSEDQKPKLVDVGCESCHGPGEKHCQAEDGSDEALQKLLREAMVITKEESQERQCMTCHDGENSPDFDFATYWPKIEHYETIEFEEAWEAKKDEE